MAYPMWFNEVDYLNAKLVQLKDAGVKDANGNAFSSINQVSDALAKAGFTPFDHYNAYGSGEGLAPSAAFNVAEYCSFKLLQLQAADATKAEWAGRTWQDVQYAIGKTGMSLGQHYSLYGAVEGVPMSNAFDGNAYLEAKLELLKATDKTWENKTAKDLALAMKELGLDPYTHYMMYGGKEGEVGPDVDVAPKEKVHPSGGGRDFTLLAEGAVLTNTVSANVTPAGTLSNGADNINAMSFLKDATILDASTTDQDVLTANVTKAITGTTITNIENINLTFGGAGSFDASGVTGGQINVAGAAANLGEVADNAKLGLSAGYGAKLTVDMAGLGASGDNTVLNVELNGTVKGASLDFDDDADDQVLETLNIVVSKDSVLSSLTTSDDSIKDVKITGKGVLTLGAVAKAGNVTGSIDASASEGAIIATLGAANADIIGSNQSDSFTVDAAATQARVVNAGKGDDVFDFGKYAALANDQFNGGAGNDTVELLAGTHVVSGMKSIENITIGKAASEVATTVQLGGATVSGAVADLASTLKIDASALTATAETLAVGFGAVTAGAVGTNNNFKLEITGSAKGANTLSGGNLNDILIGGEAADTLAGGAGADMITVGKSTDVTVDEVLMVTKGDTGVLGAAGTTVPASGTAITVTDKYDVITGMGVGDKVVLQVAGYTYQTAAGSAGATAFVNALSNTLADNSATQVRGSYVDGVFTVSATGTDSMLIYDADAATNAQSYEAVVLVGVSNDVTIASYGSSAGVSFTVA